MSSAIPGVRYEWIVTSSRLIVARCFPAALAAMVGLALLSTSAMLLGRPRARSAESVYPYMALLGQSRHAEELSRFACAVSAYPDPLQEYCARDLPTGPFSRVGLLFADGVVSRVDLTVRAQALTVGDALLLWGRPDHIRRSGRRIVDMVWNDTGVLALAIAADEHYSFLLPLQSLSFKPRAQPAIP